MDKARKVFGYLRQKFPTTSEAKIKGGISVGPHRTQPFEHQDFSTELNSAERRAWKEFENVCRIFLGNEKAGHYSEIMKKLISSCAYFHRTRIISIDSYRILSEWKDKYRKYSHSFIDIRQ